MIYARFYTEILSCNPLHPIKLTMVSYTHSLNVTLEISIFASLTNQHWCSTRVT